MEIKRTPKMLLVLAWGLAVVGGGWATLFLMSCYMTTTGLIDTEGLVWALPLPSAAIVLALVVHLWPHQPVRSTMWLRCLPVYLLAGLPLFILVTTWFDQQPHP